MCNFIGRKRELDAMSALYNLPGFQMTVMYGHRRVGKSTLLQRFVEGKKAIYYTAIITHMSQHLTT